MAQDLSIEDPNAVYFITTRTIASRLWFINNNKLEHYILAFLAKYQEMYGVVVYGFILMGNHYHLIAKFPNSNRSHFLRSFNSIIAKLVASFVPTFDGGRLWARRARVQILPLNSDVEHWSFYLALNPVSGGQTEKYSEYPLYNSFTDAACQRVKKFELIDWSDYNNRKRYNSNIKPLDCVKTYSLNYSRLPGYENFSHKEYVKYLYKNVERRRLEIVKKRISEGKGFAGRKAILATTPGSKPKSTKTSERNTKRPLILTLCTEAKRICTEKYFLILAAFKEASRRYRSGEFSVEFPIGTYRPVFLTT